MSYAAASAPSDRLESWLERHIAHLWHVEFVTALFTLLFAFAATLLTIGVLAYWIGPERHFVAFLTLGLALVFLSYPFVTPRRLPLISWLREAHARDPINDFPRSRWAVRYYFYDGYLALSAIYWAPLFFHMAFEEFRRANAIRSLDRRAMLAAVSMLAERDSRVPWHEFERALPSLPLEALQRQLALIQGVVFVSNEPAGATLTDSLRQEIRAAR